MAKTRKIREEKENSKGGSFLYVLILLIALGLMGFCGYKLYNIYMEYKKASTLYDDIKQTVVKEKEAVDEVMPDMPQNSELATQRTYTAPIEVDFDELRSINEDVIGWLYIEAIPEISYPVVRGEDNDFYLHRTYKKEDNFAGTLFIDFENSADLSDSNTILYGHNMKDGSMFGKLKEFKMQETYEKSPYIWMLTPHGDYKYEIFSAYVAGVGSDTYTIIKGPGEELKQYLEDMFAKSEIDTGMHEFSIKDKCLTLSTCTGDSTTRYVVQAIQLQ